LSAALDQWRRTYQPTASKEERDARGVYLRMNRWSFFMGPCLGAAVLPAILEVFLTSAPPWRDSFVRCISRMVGFRACSATPMGGRSARKIPGEQLMCRISARRGGVSVKLNLQMICCDGSNWEGWLTQSEIPE
jgi:hypothetical protein